MRKFLHISSKLSYMLICVQEWYWQLPYIWTQCFDGSSYSSARSVYAWACTVKIIVRLLYPYFGNFSCISFVCVTRGGVISSAGPAKAGPCTFQQVVGLVPRLHRHPCVAKYTCVYDVQLLVIWRIRLLAVVLLQSVACGDSPPAPVVDPPHMREWSFICSGLTTFEMPAPPLVTHQVQGVLTIWTLCSWEASLLC